MFDHRVEQPVHPCAGRARDRIDLVRARCLEFLGKRADQFGIDQIDLVERDQSRLFIEAIAVNRQLFLDHLQRIGGIMPVDVDQVDQHPAALDMAEEPVTDPGPVGRAFDQARDVGEDEFAVLVPHHSELRGERGKGVIANLGFGVGDLVDEGRLARIGQPEQARVGEQLEPQPDIHLAAQFAGLVLARGAVGAGLVRSVAASAHAALEQHDFLPDLGHVEQHRLAVVVEHLRAERNLDHQILAGCTGAVLAHPGNAALGFEVLCVTEVDQGVEPGDRFKNDVAAAPAVTAVGPAIFDVHFAPERHLTGAALARADEYFGLIEKMHGGATNG